MLPPSPQTLPQTFENKIAADRFYLTLAIAERVKSDDPKALKVAQSGVGAVIVGRDGVVAQSANVLPPKLKLYHQAHNQGISDDERYHFIEHAERAVIFKALLEKKDIGNSTMYCTRFPCSDCARAIVWSGIRRAVFANGYGREERWIESQRAALHILRKGGVKVRILKMPEEISVGP